MHYLLFMYLGRFICLSVVFSCICVYQCGVINCSKPKHCVLSEFSSNTNSKKLLNYSEFLFSFAFQFYKMAPNGTVSHEFLKIMFVHFPI